MLILEDIHFSYNGFRVLDGFNLHVDSGQMIGLVGSNGAGKTTLLKLVCGVLKLQKGKIRVEKKDLNRLRSSQRAQLVSIVPQNPQLPLNLTVLNLVLMGRNPYQRLLSWENSHDLDIVHQAMELTNTAHLANRHIGTLSGGERQRAIVATSLAQKTPLLLLDEPTSSLDLTHQIKLMDLVKRVQDERNCTILLAMHDLTLAAQYCDKIVMLANGRNYSEGPPTKVLTPESIWIVYGTKTTILKHPTTGSPVVVPAQEHPSAPLTNIYGNESVNKNGRPSY